MTTPETPAPLVELAAAGAAYREAKEKLKALRSQRATLVAPGFKKKIPATELAGRAGLSHQRLYLVRDLGLEALETPKFSWIFRLRNCWSRCWTLRPSYQRPSGKQMRPCGKWNAFLSSRQEAERLR